MNLAPSTLPLFLNLIFDGLFIVFTLLAVQHLNWKALLTDHSLQHRVGFSVVALIVIWSMRAGVSEGLGLHFFMVTCFHLMFGWQITILVVLFVQLGLVAFGVESIVALGMNGITSGVIPIFVTFFCWKTVERKQWYNPFAFIFGAGFAGAILSVLVSTFFISIVFLATGTYTVADLSYELWAYMPLVALPEGILNGMIIAGLVTFKPEWVLLFDEEKYYQ